MNRRHRVVRASFYLSLALPLMALACGGDSFSTGSGDGGEEGSIILGDGGEGHDATTDGASSDAHHDGPADDGAKHDGSIADSGMADVSCQPTYQECTLSSGTSCIATVPDTTHGLFVAPPPQGQPSSCGAESAPCDTVSAALPYLVGGKNIIYVAEGTYTDQVTLPAGVTVQGNWLYMGAGQWSRQCVFPAKTIIEAPAGSNRVITVNYSSGSSTLDSLTLTNATTAGTGVSQYGIFASSSGTTAGALVLTDVSINVAAGGPGATGVQGGDGGPPVPPCTPGGTLQNGTPGKAGGGAPAGGYGASGYSPSTGAAGTSGLPGSNGSNAPTCGETGGPDCVQAFGLVNGDYTTASNCCIQNGVGSTCVACTVALTPLSGGTGIAGCGSTGSGGGAPGTGGGASIGLFVWNESVTVNGSSITTVGGGAGGNGGPGGPVYPGSAGAPGAQSPQLVSSACSQQTVGGNPVCVAAYKPLDGGSPGGSGFSGGIGGQGGGGNGGDSYCWFVGVGSGGKVNADSFTSAHGQTGPGGLGGNQGGGTSQGTKGASLQHN
jgi:hypothetical protein